MKKALGYFTFVLHSHLPYVITHGKWPHGTDWLDEAACATYIPLLNVFHDLIKENISPKATVGITPILAEMLSSDVFKEKFPGYLQNKIQISRSNAEEFARTGEQQLETLARMWEQWYQARLSDFTDRYDKDLLGAFRELQDNKHIEIITCAATHGYLPLLSEDISVQAQVKAGVKAYEKHFGSSPRGIWLPECAYRPAYKWAPPVGTKAKPKMRKGIEEFLSENGIEYFIIDSHLLQGGEAAGVYIDRFGALRKVWRQFEKGYQPAPVDAEKSPQEAYWVQQKDNKKSVAFLTREPKTALQVWSGEYGYPGDGNYLDFHKKHSDGGIRYWRITSSKADLADKQLYVHEWAMQTIQPQADHFIGLVEASLREHYERTQTPGITCAPFDTELFGHWWWEGPLWLKAVLKGLAESDSVDLITGGEFLDLSPASVVISLPEGSWGKGGFHYIWLNEDTEWTWKHIYETEREMIDLASRYGSSADGDVGRILKQAAREILLLQSSDWQFLISTWSARDYAEIRFDHHYHTFKKLRELVISVAETGRISSEDWTFVQQCEAKDRVFPEIDVSWWEKSAPQD